MPPARFVILHHLAATGEHWDFMLEREDHLITWRMHAEPAGRDACPISCTRINDHRKRYLDYQGPIGGGRGIVTRVDHGEYELLAADEQAWTLRLIGRRLCGDFRLARTAPESASRWTFTAV